MEKIENREEFFDTILKNAHLLLISNLSCKRNKDHKKLSEIIKIEYIFFQGVRNVEAIGKMSASGVKKSDVFMQRFVITNEKKQQLKYFIYNCFQQKKLIVFVGKYIVSIFYEA